MADPIGEIPVKITGDWADLQVQLLAAEAAAVGAAKDIGEAFNEASKQLSLFDSFDHFGNASQLELFGKSLSDIGKEAEAAAKPLMELPEVTDHVSEAFHRFAEGVGEWIEHPLKMAGEAAQGLIEALGPVGVVALAVGAGIVELGKKIVDLVLEEGAAAEATNNLANRLNLSFEETKKLSEMAQIAGVGIDSLARVSMRLADALDNPAGAGKKVAEALDKMGIEASDSGDALKKLLEKLAEIPDATERISKAHEIMGRGAVQLEPLLRNYNELSAAVESLGGQLSGDMVRGLLKADDAADKLGIAWAHLKENLAATFAPAVMAGLDFLTNALSSPPKNALDDQIEKLRVSIQGLEADSNKASIAVTSMMGGGFTRMGGNGALEAMKAQLQSLEDQKLAQKEAFNRSKEYNEALDKLAHDSQMRQKDAAENQKKLDEAWHKQNLEDIKAEQKAREDAIKANEKVWEEFTKAGKQLDDQTKKTQITLDKAWYQYVLETRKAIGITDEAKHKFGELSEITVDLKDRLPAPILAAYEAGLKLNDAIKKLGIDAKASGSELIEAFDTFGASGKGNLEQIEIAWSKVSGQIDKIGHFDLPLAIREYEKYIALLQTHGAAQGEIFQVQERLLELEVKEKALRGESATEQIIQLEQIRNQMDALNLATRGLGQVYVDIMSSFHNAFSELGKGIADAIVEGKNLGDVLINTFKNLEKHILETTIGYVFKQLDAQLTKTGGLLDQIAQQITKAVGASAKLPIPGGSNSPVNVPAGADKIPGAGGIPTGKTPSGGGSGAASDGFGLNPGTISAIEGAVTAVSSVLQYLQGRRMEQDIGRIEVTTRGQLNEALNLRRDLWDQQTNLFHKLDDMWNEIRNVVDILRLIGQNGLGVGTESEGGGKTLAEQIADVINSRPASVEGSTQALEDAAAAYTNVVKAADGVSYGLQSLTPQIESLSNAVDSANTSFAQFNEVTTAVAPLLDVVRELGFHGYDATPGSGNNSVGMIAPESVYGFHGYDATPNSWNNAITGEMNNGTVGFAPGNNAGSQQIGYVTVNAVDPSGRQIANATIKGLEERGIRVR